MQQCLRFIKRRYIISINVLPLRSTFIWYFSFEIYFKMGCSNAASQALNFHTVF
uniref:Uncharacterized protein n=1 Tax=Anguilla anguilla TaxID=7936 RepID=A0A0E9QAM1_ANGAN